MISTTKCHRVGVTFAALVFLAPLPAFAAVQITEVMYDAPGADQGHEWVEVTNTGSEAANIAGYKFFEGGTNHGLAAAHGTTTLGAGESAVISNNPSDFLSDFPAYAGALFKSSFSLNNTGETVSLKDAKLNIIDSVSYDSSEGGSGDGNTLHLVSNGFIAGAPDPGSYSSIPPKPIAKPAPVPAASPIKTAPNKSKSSSSKSVIPASTEGSAAVYQGIQELPQAPQTPWLAYIVGLLALVVVGAAGVIYVRLAGPGLRETPSAADEFEIVE